MIMYGGVSNPPFRAVIAEYPWWQQYHNESILEIQYRQLLNAARCDNLECLRRLDAATLANATQQVYYIGYNGSSTQYYGYGDFYFGPSIDGIVLRDLPSNEFKQGHFTKVPLLTTRDGYEGVSFSNTSETSLTGLQSDIQTLFSFAKSAFFARLFQLYPASAFNSTFFQRQQIFGDFIINCPTYYLSSAFSNYGLPIWKQIFNDGSQLHGATHTILFSNTYGTHTGDNYTLFQVLADWYISFTAELDPNAVSYSNLSKPYWPQYLSPGGPGRRAHSTC
jgi:carboxylesterase type B